MFQRVEEAVRAGHPSNQRCVQATALALTVPALRSHSASADREAGVPTTGQNLGRYILTLRTST